MINFNFIINVKTFIIFLKVLFFIEMKILFSHIKITVSNHKITERGKETYSRDLIKALFADLIFDLFVEVGKNKKILSYLIADKEEAL